MGTDENVFREHDIQQDFQNVVDENMDHEILDNFVENGADETNVEITKF